MLHPILAWVVSIVIAAAMYQATEPDVVLHTNRARAKGAARLLGLIVFWGMTLNSLLPRAPAPDAYPPLEPASELYCPALDQTLPVLCVAAANL